MKSTTVSEAEQREMIDRLAAAHAGLAQLVLAIDSDEWVKKSQPEVWSPAEIIEHVLLSERSLMNKVSDHKDDPPVPDWGEVVAGKEELLRRVLPGGGKAKSGPKLSTFTGLDQVTVAHCLGESHKRFADLLEETSNRPLKAIVLPQSFFGSLNAYLWLLYVPLHTERHLRQLRHSLRFGAGA